MSCNNPLTISVNGQSVSVPCCYCQGCRKDKVSEWSDRIRFERNYFFNRGFSSSFVTLTYDDVHLDTYCVSLDDVQKFNKRLRKNLKGRPYKYYLSSEYGGQNSRPHYHACLLGIDFEKDFKLVHDTWGQGMIDLKPLDSRSIRYVLKYIYSESRGQQLKEIYESSGLTPPFTVMSKGIGRQYLLDHIDSIRENGGYYRQGKFVKIPKYYKDLLCVKSELSQELANKKIADAHNSGFDDVSDFVRYERYAREKDLVTSSRNKGAVLKDSSALYSDKSNVNALADSISFWDDVVPF